MKYYATMLNEKGVVAVDDTILVKDAPSTAGSRMLEGFKPLFSAEAVKRLEEKGYLVAGKTHVGEFGLDLVGEFSYYNKANESEKLYGAAAQAVADNNVKYALSVDMNGSARRAAMLSGVSFLKPTYGTVSRYGVISCAASGEQIGVCAKDCDGIAEIMSVIAGNDTKDGTSLKDTSYEYKTDADIKGAKVAIVKELLDKASDDVKESVYAYAEELKDQGVTVEEISLDIFDTANTAWQILMCAETCNNVSRYDGVKFGHRSDTYKNIDELYVNSRTEGFNFLTKAVILYGSDVLSKNRYADCYDKALRIRRVVADKIKEVLSTYDALLTPVCSKTEYVAYDIKDAFKKVYDESVFTCVPNLIGTPAISTNKVQLMGAHLTESKLLSIAKLGERKGE
ncbi:MAG: amidase family protein [Eubacteriales bacterium]|nr:amidase family protein [Eubacteriales bacterium]